MVQENAITIDINDEYSDDVSEDRLREIVDITLLEEQVAGPVEVEIVVTDDEEVRQLNSQYRGLDETTDVLAFALTEGSEDGFILPPEISEQLGNVIISYPKAVEQAQEAGHSPDKEMAILLVHGVLHLLGYDHIEDDDARVMQERERIIMGRVS